ncbi:hypothetical protein DEU56DRAFT_125834 [Suillus clintonianus]|uniref:uncharacterized protein n=1 Tax=Suillus clintonianus TaxID=1904413 RepID=UPI001B85F392|nr:uncharacterized protein DEU56DRAFT_125834 [Suillus clintonianus]KAG2119350.1 hypothetical protein DEU56DRAFT_125834 [Suillus clintonianus]
MQLSVLFSALISFVILAAAAPTPRAISIEELSSKRKELDTNSQRDLLEEGRKPDQLETNSVTYISYVTLDGLVIPEDKKREELGTNNASYSPREELGTNNASYSPREELGTNNASYSPREELGTNNASYSPREELGTNNASYSPREELASAID